jgi:hypothetical protein
MQSVLKFSEPSSPYANLGKPLLEGSLTGARTSP